MADRQDRDAEEEEEAAMEEDNAGDNADQREAQAEDVMEEDDSGDDEEGAALVVAERMYELLEDQEHESWGEYESGEEPEGAEGSESGGEAATEQYDTTLPTRHVYLGETEELRGRTVQEENDYVSLPLLQYASLINLVLVPSQTLPLTIFHPLHVSMLRSVIARDRTFGIVHSKVSQDGTSEMARYGTTAEIYEYQEDDSTGTLSIKAKGRQRFRILSTSRETSGLLVAKVKILPEIRMGNPFELMRLQSLDKLTLPHPQDATTHTAHARHLACVRTANSWRVRGRNAWLTPWPSWVYNQYDDLLLAQRVVNEVKKSTMIKLDNLKLPRDPQDLSHWAAINLPLDDSHRLALLGLNTPTQRLRYILSVLSKCKMLTCVRCSEVIGDTADIFSMSVEGPQGTFVNPGGYVHEMMTLSKASSLSYYGRPSTEHSWFPEYAWTIATCSNCHSHIGWKFTATKRKLMPRKFYGVTRKAVKAKLVWDGDEGEMRHVI